MKINRWQRMRMLNPQFSNFCCGLFMFIVFGGFGAVSIYLGWIPNQLKAGYTIGNGLNDNIIVLARLSLLYGLLGLFGAFMAYVEFRHMLNQTGHGQ